MGRGRKEGRDEGEKQESRTNTLFDFTELFLCHCLDSVLKATYEASST